MKFKTFTEEQAVFTSDPWYDLVYGGYIKPEDMLEDEIDVLNVKDSINLLKVFLEGAEENNNIILG